MCFIPIYDNIEEMNLDISLSPREHEEALAIAHLIERRVKYGIDDKTQLENSEKESSNSTIIRYALEIYKVWGALFPQERLDFIETAKHEIDVERPIKAALKAGGYTPIAFPTRLDGLFRVMMPSVKTQSRNFWKPMLKHIPELRRSNYA